MKGKELWKAFAKENDLLFASRLGNVKTAIKSSQATADADIAEQFSQESRSESAICAKDNN